MTEKEIEMLVLNNVTHRFLHFLNKTCLSCGGCSEKAKNKQIRFVILLINQPALNTMLGLIKCNLANTVLSTTSFGKYGPQLEI